MCNKETYIGKTNHIRKRTNVHISSCRSGTTKNIFDKHVHDCGKRNKNLKEPYFKLYGMMSLRREEGLLFHEASLQRKHLDTMNR